MRDLFEEDDGGWLTNPALLDRLLAEKLQVEGEKVGTEGWKWVATAADLPWGVTNGLRELDGVLVPRTPDEDARLAELDSEDAAIEQPWSDEPHVTDAAPESIPAIEPE